VQEGDTAIVTPVKEERGKEKHTEKGATSHVKGGKSRNGSRNGGGRVGKKRGKIFPSGKEAVIQKKRMILHQGVAGPTEELSLSIWREK